MTPRKYPKIGEGAHALYKVGTCEKCSTPIFGLRPEARKLCYFCRAKVGTLKPRAVILGGLKFAK